MRTGLHSAKVPTMYLAVPGRSHLSARTAPVQVRGDTMYAGTTSTKFGQFAVAEPVRFDVLAFHGDTPLKEVEHTIPIPVLDQEDLHKQGIDVTKLVPGAADTDALGSCTCNTGTAHIAERWAAAGKDITGLKLTGGTGAIAMSG